MLLANLGFQSKSETNQFEGVPSNFEFKKFRSLLSLKGVLNFKVSRRNNIIVSFCLNLRTLEVTLSLFGAISKTSMFLPFANRILYNNFELEFASSVLLSLSGKDLLKTRRRTV